MEKSLTRRPAVAVLCALAMGIVSVTAAAETSRTDVGYVVDPRDMVVWNGYGGCWRTGEGPPPMPRPECGDKSYVPAPVARAAEPVPRVVERTPPAAVAAATPAPRPVIERVTLDADALFDFDKAVLRPAGREALDDFVSKLKGIDPEMIMAIGYADRVGSTSYNQQLSEQRVEAVKDYLVSKGVEPNRIQTEGKGEMQPVTKAGECEGPASASVIACLQPDRRVVIEVTGDRIRR